MEITVVAEKVNVETLGYNKVHLNIVNIDKDQLLENLTIEDCLDHFSREKFMDAIGVDDCKEHFNLIDNIED